MTYWKNDTGSTLGKLNATAIQEDILQDIENAGEGIDIISLKVEILVTGAVSLLHLVAARCLLSILVPLIVRRVREVLTRRTETPLTHQAEVTAPLAAMTPVQTTRLEEPSASL